MTRADLLANTLFEADGRTLVDPKDLRLDPALEGALDTKGKLLIHPAQFWQRFSSLEITAFCVRHGFYCIPTVELVEWLKKKIGCRKAIEIGAGSGVLAEALGIPATDSRVQERRKLARKFQQIQQATIRYGSNVQKMDAATAVKRHNPEVVVAAWIMHKYRAAEPWRKGNIYGVEEEKILSHVQQYIHVGQTRVHEAKPILESPHEEFEPPWLVSRGSSTGRNYICWWER